ISRIPDARSAKLVYRAISAGAAAPTKRAGIRNVRRPFANNVFSTIGFPLHANLLSCVPTPLQPDPLSVGHLNDAAIYLMLHGNYQNGAAFTGEDGQGGYPVAI